MLEIFLMAAISMAGVGSPLIDTSGFNEVIKRKTVRIMGPDAATGKMNQMCSGYLLSPTEIVTAGHCVVRGPQQFVVEVYDPKTKKMKPHRLSELQYSYTSTEDGAIFKLKNGAFAPGDQSLPILSDTHHCDPKNSRIFSSGYGYNELGTDSLRINEYTAIADPKDEDAVPSLNYGFKMKSKHGKSCVGDSGGPIFCTRGKQLIYVGLFSNISRSKQSYSNENIKDYTSFCNAANVFEGSSIEDLRDRLKNAPRVRVEEEAGETGETKNAE